MLLCILEGVSKFVYHVQQGLKLTFFPTCPMGRWMSFLVALTNHAIAQTFYNISNMIPNMFMIDGQYNDINS